MAKIKVRGGTAKGTDNLCPTCRFAKIARGTNNEVIVECNQYERPILFRVAECNQYEDKSQPTLYAMEEIAWRVITKGTRVLGFVDAKEFAKREREQ